MTPAERQALTDALVPTIGTALLRDRRLREDAVVYGRQGLAEMTDDELLEAATLWGVTLEDAMTEPR